MESLRRSLSQIKTPADLSVGGRAEAQGSAPERGFYPTTGGVLSGFASLALIASLADDTGEGLAEFSEGGFEGVVSPFRHHVGAGGDEMGIDPERVVAFIQALNAHLGLIDADQLAKRFKGFANGGLTGSKAETS